MKARFDLRCVRAELRLPGALFRLLIPAFSERFFLLSNRFLACFSKGRWHGRRCVAMDERVIVRADGGTLRLCVFRSKTHAASRATGLLWLHGGGYAMGLPEQDRLFIERFVHDGGCVAVAPDYRLSTEAPYPAALSDCYDALLFLLQNAEALGVRSDQIFVGGDSAGGGLTAALCLYARDCGAVRNAFQMPLYPMLDDRMATASSQNNAAPVWNSRSNETAWRLYLGTRFQTDDVPIYAAAARAKDLCGLPPTCTFVGTIEPFYDETVRFVEALKACGVPVFFRTYDGCFHAFDILCPASRAARSATAFLMESFRHAQRSYFCAQPVQGSVSSASPAARIPFF